MADDIFDIVDSNDTVVGSAPRSQVHSLGHMHRSAHVLIFSLDGKKILLQMRSPKKDTYPSCYTTSCSGHVDSGETYDCGVEREMREETGICIKSSELVKIGKIAASPSTGMEFVYVYEYRIGEAVKLKFFPEEIEGFDWIEIPKFERMIAEFPEKFTPAFLEVWKFFKSKKS